MIQFHLIQIITKFILGTSLILGAEQNSQNPIHLDYLIYILI